MVLALIGVRSALAALVQLRGQLDQMGKQSAGGAAGRGAAAEHQRTAEPPLAQRWLGNFDCQLFQGWPLLQWPPVGEAVQPLLADATEPTANKVTTTTPITVATLATLNHILDKNMTNSPPITDAAGPSAPTTEYCSSRFVNK